MFIPSQGLFGFLGPASQRAGGAQETGRGHSQGSWPEPAKEDIPYHGTSCLVYKLGGLAGGDRCSGTGWASVRVVSSCTVHHLFSFLPFPLDFILFPTFPYNYYYCYCCSYLFILFKLLNCSYLNPRVLHSFLILLPAPPGEQAATWCLVAGWG